MILSILPKPEIYKNDCNNNVKGMTTYYGIKFKKSKSVYNF